MDAPLRSIRMEELTALSIGSLTTTIGTVHTPKGKRLEIGVPAADEAIWLDALGLESVSWQDEAVFADLIQEWNRRHEARLPTPPSIDAAADVEHLVTVRNEYAIVDVSTGEDDGTEFVRIDSKRLGYAARLTAAELAALSAQDASLLSEFLSTPFGPERG